MNDVKAVLVILEIIFLFPKDIVRTDLDMLRGCHKMQQNSHSWLQLNTIIVRISAAVAPLFYIKHLKNNRLAMLASQGAKSHHLPDAALLPHF